MQKRQTITQNCTLNVNTVAYSSKCETRETTRSQHAVVARSLENGNSFCLLRQRRGCCRLVGTSNFTFKSAVMVDVAHLKTTSAAAKTPQSDPFGCCAQQTLFTASDPSPFNLPANDGFNRFATNGEIMSSRLFATNTSSSSSS